MELFNSLKTGIERERERKRVCLNQAVPYTLLCFPEQRSTVRAISEEREGKIYITESPAAARAVSTFHRLADSRFKKDTFTRRRNDRRSLLLFLGERVRHPSARGYSVGAPRSRGYHYHHSKLKRNTVNRIKKNKSVRTTASPVHSESVFSSQGTRRGGLSPRHRARQPLQGQVDGLLQLHVVGLEEPLAQVGEVRRRPLLEEQAALGLEAQLQLRHEVVVHQGLGRLHALSRL